MEETYLARIMVEKVVKFTVPPGDDPRDWVPRVEKKVSSNEYDRVVSVTIVPENALEEGPEIPAQQASTNTALSGRNGGIQTGVQTENRLTHATFYGKGKKPQKNEQNTGSKIRRRNGQQRDPIFNLEKSLGKMGLEREKKTRPRRDRKPKGYEAPAPSPVGDTTSDGGDSNRTITMDQTP